MVGRLFGVSLRYCRVCWAQSGIGPKVECRLHDVLGEPHLHVWLMLSLPYFQLVCCGIFVAVDGAMQHSSRFQLLLRRQVASGTC